MKRLSVMWMPETMMRVSLTIATPRHTDDEFGQFELARTGEFDKPMPYGRLIVISGSSELQARVMMSMPLEAA